MKKFATSLLVLFVLFFALTSCSKEKPQDNANKTEDTQKENGNKEATDKKDAEKDKVVTVGLTNNPKDFTAVDPGDSSSTTLTELLYSPLVSLNNDLKYEKMLAADIQNKDGKVYTIKLKDAKWSDGKPITADDVLFTFKFIAQPDTASMVAKNFRTIEGFDEEGLLKSDQMTGIKKIDDKTIEITLKKPMHQDLFFDDVLKAVLIVPEHVWKDFSPKTFREQAEVIKPTVTSGPMKLESYTANESVVFTPNENYFLGKPIIKKLIVKIIDGTDYRTQFESKGIDMNYPMIGTIPATDYDAIKALPGLKFNSGRPSTLQFLFVNHDNLKDSKMRLALSYAIDREMLVKDVLKGQGEPVDSFYSSFNPFRDPEHQVIKRDLEKAKQLLKESGYDVSRPLIFNVPTGNKTREQAAVIIQNNLKDIGLDVKIEKMDMPTCMSKAKEGAFDITIMGNTFVPTNPTYDLSFFITSGNFNRYKNEKVDQLVTAIKNEVSTDKMKELCIELQRILNEEQPMVFLYGQKDLYVTTERMKVGEPKDYGTFLNVYKWDTK